MYKYFFTAVFILLLSTCEKRVIKPPDNGTIEGKIVYRSELSTAEQKLENIKISISGTSFHAYTDSVGEYKLFEIPAGTYNLQALKEWPGTPCVLGRIKNVSVNDGQMTEVPDIVCTTDTARYQVDLAKYFGGIQGKVRTSNYQSGISYDYSDVVVIIPGTSFYANADSGGHFMILNLPEGTYDLQVDQVSTGSYGAWRDNLTSLRHIEVVAGELTVTPDIVFSIPYLPSDNFENVSLVDTSGSKEYRLLDPLPQKVFNQNLLLKGKLLYYRTYVDTLISIFVNGDRSVISSQKGQFYHPVLLDQKINTVKVWIGDGDEPAKNVIGGDVYYYSSPSKITPYITWNSINYSEPVGDFDIRLINTTIDDTCWYKNTMPEWGYPDIHWDDPRLDYDFTDFRYETSGNEGIYLGNAAPGSYVIELEYFDNYNNPEDMTTPHISVNTSIGDYNYNSPQPMAVGDVWRVVDIEVAQDGGMTVTEVNTLISLQRSSASMRKRKTNSFYSNGL